MMHHLGIRVKRIMKSCDTCRMDKACSKATCKEAAKRSEVPGKKGFVDLKGPFTTLLEELRYWLQIVDNATRDGFCYFIRNKDMIQEKAEKYINMVQTFNYQVKFICCDNAGKNEKVWEM